MYHHIIQYLLQPVDNAEVIGFLAAYWLVSPFIYGLTKWVVNHVPSSS